MKRTKIISIICILLTMALTFSACSLEIELQDKNTIISTIEKEIPNAKLSDFIESPDGCDRTYVFDTGKFKFTFKDTYEYTKTFGIYNGKNSSECDYVKSLIDFASNEISPLSQKYNIVIIDCVNKPTNLSQIEQYKEKNTLIIVMEEYNVYKCYVSSTEQVTTLFDFINVCASVLEQHLPDHGSKLCIEQDMHITLKYYKAYKTSKNPEYNDTITSCLIPFSKDGLGNMSTYARIALESYEETINDGYLKNQK